MHLDIVSLAGASYALETHNESIQMYEIRNLLVTIMACRKVFGKVVQSMPCLKSVKVALVKVSGWLSHHEWESET